MQQNTDRFTKIAAAGFDDWRAPSSAPWQSTEINTMHSLSTELKGVLARRIEIARPDEIMAITSALTALKVVTPAPTMARQTITDRFERVGDDIVRDHQTGLEWARRPLPDRHEWKAAADACRALKLGGHTDWRLPTVRELQSLVDFERHDPVINTDYFECPADWFWSNTPYAGDPSDCAWFVYFGSCYAFWSGHNFAGCVRACRVGQF